jgi:hypothetical protein
MVYCFWNKKVKIINLFLILSYFLFSCAKSKVLNFRKTKTCREILKKDQKLFLVDEDEKIDEFFQKGKVYPKKLEFEKEQAFLVNYGSNVRSLYFYLEPKVPEVNIGYTPDYAHITIRAEKANCGLGPECSLNLTEKPIKTSKFQE